MSELSRDTAYGYLLGELDAAAAEALEARLFEDDALHEEVRALEAELIDDYVAGDLAEARRPSFEARYLADPEQRGRVATARALRARAGAQPEVAPRSAPAPSLWARLRAWFGAAGGAGWALAAAVVLLAVGGGVVAVRGPQASAVRTTLVPDGLRAAEEAPEVALLGVLELELALDGAKVGPKPEVRLRRGQAIVLRAPAAGGEAAVLVTIESADLAPGSYSIELWSSGADDATLVATYAFRAH